MINAVKKYLIPSQDNNHIPHIFYKKSLAIIFGFAFLLFFTSLGSSYILKNTDLGANVLLGLQPKNPSIIQGSSKISISLNTKNVNHILQGPIEVGSLSPALAINDLDTNLKPETVIDQVGFIDKLLVNQPRYVQNIYLFLILIIYIVFISMIVMQLRYKHSIKHITFAVLLLCTLGALAYLNSDFVLSFL